MHNTEREVNGPFSLQVIPAVSQCIQTNAHFYFRHLFIYFESQDASFPVHPRLPACSLTQLAEAL